MDARTLPVVFLLSASACCAAAPPPKDELAPSPAKAGEREGLEGGQWLVEAFGNPAKAAMSRPRGQEENRMLRIEYFSGAADKVAVKRMTGLRAAEKGTLRCWVHCQADDPPQAAFALLTGENHVWQETEPVQLKAGWNALTFDLAAKKWKSASSEWKNEGALESRDDVRAIECLVFNGQRAGVLHVDGLRIDRDGTTAGLEALIAKLGAEDFAEREKAERALLEVGRSALESLREALDSEDTEIRTRAKTLIEKLTGGKANPPDGAQDEPQGPEEAPRVQKAMLWQLRRAGP